MAAIELNQLINIVHEKLITPEIKGLLNNVCFMSLTEQHDVKSTFSDSDIEFLLKHTDISGVSKSYGYKWTALHWCEENKVILSSSVKDYLLHHLDLNGTDNNGNTLLFKAIVPNSYFNHSQIDYLLHTLNPNVENIFGETALDNYLYNDYNTLNEAQLTYLIEHTNSSSEAHSNSTPLKNFINGKPYITRSQVDLLLSRNLDWDTHKTMDNVLMDNILIYSLKQKEEELFTPAQWDYVIDNTIHNVKEALIVMNFFSRVTNLSEQAQNKLKEIEHLYNLMKDDEDIKLPKFQDFSPNLPLSLAKNISLNLSNSLVIKILSKSLRVIDEHFLLSTSKNSQPILQRIKNMFLSDKKSDPIIEPSKHYYSEEKLFASKNKSGQHNNQQL